MDKQGHGILTGQNFLREILRKNHDKGDSQTFKKISTMAVIYK